jgi:hypothetical protein
MDMKQVTNTIDNTITAQTCSSETIQIQLQ